jgi:DICT domain-containing protein
MAVSAGFMKNCWLGSRHGRQSSDRKSQRPDSNTHFQKSFVTLVKLSTRKSSRLGQEVPPNVKDFSLFAKALELTDTSRSDLGTIAGISRRDFSLRESFIFRAQAPCIEYACLMIENALLLRTNRTTRIYAGFEKLSCLQPVIDRYLRIADISASVHVFGEADWRPPHHPNMRVIELLPEQCLARELFLIAESATFNVALVARAEDRLVADQTDERTFTAFKSSEAKVVSRLASDAEGLIDWSFAA